MDISIDIFEVPKRTRRTNTSILHMFEPKKIRDLQNLIQDRVSVELIFIGNIYLGNWLFDTPTSVEELKTKRPASTAYFSPEHKNFDYNICKLLKTRLQFKI